MDSKGNERPSGGHSPTRSPPSKGNVTLSNHFEVVSQRPTRRILSHLLQEDEVQVSEFPESLPEGDPSLSGSAGETAIL